MDAYPQGKVRWKLLPVAASRNPELFEPYFEVLWQNKLEESDTELVPLLF